MRRLCFLLLIAFTRIEAAPPTPAEIYGELFDAVQTAQVFPDQKAFVDCVPKRPPAEILAEYEKQKGKPGFDLSAFVKSNFTTAQSDTIRTHIEALWDQLSRQAAKPPEGSSLLALPQPYVVPGGRFQELYYWDSYFVMLGLMESGKVEAVRHMVENFAHLIETYGFIPNANRTYYLTRSQPPFFSLMLDLLAEREGDVVYREFRPALEKEYHFWMDEQRGHAVSVDGVVLNRYFDAADTPREESYLIDKKNAGRAKDADAFYRHIRSAAESGWDFSSRWFADSKDIATIRTTDILPVDLNSLIYHLEVTLAKARKLSGDAAGAKTMTAQAERRRGAINDLFWSAEEGWYMDYDLAARRLTPEPTLAGMMPFFLEVAPKERMAPAAKTLESRFLKPGGVVTTLRTTGEQWDAPNGWAPLQWITIAGLRNYGQMPLAETIAQRWMKQNLAVYRATGKLTEKYDVIDLSRPGGGGEYPSQDGFGWTNGVLLKLLNLYGEP